MSSNATRKELLVLYKQILRSAKTFPSKNRAKIYQAIREEWRDYVDCTDEDKIQKQVAVAYKGLSQLRQYDIASLTANSRGGGGNLDSPDWSITLEQNPMPKPDNYKPRKK